MHFRHENELKYENVMTGKDLFFMNVRPDVYNCPLWLRGLAWSLDKLKSLYLHYHSVYDHQTCKDGDISWRAPNHKVIQSIDHVALQGHVTNKNHYISITRVPLATKLDKMMTPLDGLLPIMSHDPSITRLCEIRSSLTGGGSARKRLSCHQESICLTH